MLVVITDFQETLIKSSTRSVATSLARPFEAGSRFLLALRRVATIEYPIVSSVATRRENFPGLFPALKGGANSC